MNTEIVETITNQIVKLSIAKAILANKPKDEAKSIIKELTGINIEDLEKNAQCIKPQTK